TAEALRAISAGSFVNMPLMEQGRVVAMVFVNHATPRHYTDSDLRLMREVAERVRSATERARSEAALRESEAQFRVFAQATPIQIWSSWAD
ncbi:GAF domain-containing protein, partial [Bacillus amyloliquefaciens]|nr:GAF domain-containing protein [Bacillus amyloliquefaciens]